MRSKQEERVDQGSDQQQVWRTVRKPAQNDRGRKKREENQILSKKIQVAQEESYNAVSLFVKLFVLRPEKRRKESL